MPVITLPDGSQRQFDRAISIAEVAASIGPGLAKAALAGKLDGVLVDTSALIDHDASLSIVTDKDPDGLDNIRHSTAHLLVNAVQELFPDAQVTIGPVMTRAYEHAGEADSTLGKHANLLALDLAAARTALESEQGRARELDRMLAERSSALEANGKSASQLDADLQAARADATALGAELKASREKVAVLNQQLKRSESEINATRDDLDAAKIRASSYLDLLRTREWRHGFDQNLFRELDAKVGAADAGHGALALERDRLQGQVAALEARLSTQAAEAATERSRLTAELAARDRALAEARERGSGDARRVTELLEAAELKQAEQATQIAQLRAEQAAQVERLPEAETHEQELTVRMAHLQEARGPIQTIEADVKRLTEELTAKSAAIAEHEEENCKLRSTLERARGALEEREFLIRRLERSESNNAKVLGRIQTSIERLGSVPMGPSAAAGTTAELPGELIRIGGVGPATYGLLRQTRIGRAAGCDMQIDSSSVSRHHALVVVGARDTVIEDLNSTNGVLVNGRKVVCQVLSDGDAITIGVCQFRYSAKPVPRTPEPTATQPAP